MAENEAGFPQDKPEGKRADEGLFEKHRRRNRESEYENPIGLTQAFGPVSVSEKDEEGDEGEDASWGSTWINNYEGESDGWDRIVPDDDTPDDWHEPDDGEFSQEDENARRHARHHAEHHMIVDYSEISDKPSDDIAAKTDFNEQAKAALEAEKRARAEGADAAAAAAAASAAAHAAADVTVRADVAQALGDDGDDFPDVVDSLEPQDAPPVLFGGEDAAPAAGDAAVKGKHGKHAKELRAHERKSQRTRRTLIVIIVLVIALLAGLAYFGYHLLVTSQNVAVQQASSATSGSAIASSSDRDASTATAKKTTVPDLAALLGKTQDQAIAALGHGATVRTTRDVTDEGSSIKKSVTIALTDEPADTKTGTPTVYLGLNDAGNIVQAGYSTSTASLGYGALGFVDAVSNEHVIEKTLQEANIMVNEGAAVLPSDKTQYTTYGSDGTTVTRERYSFTGDVTVNNTPCSWSAVLSYDYATANQTGDLADTIRVVYVYVTVK